MLRVFSPPPSTSRYCKVSRGAATDHVTLHTSTSSWLAEAALAGNSDCRMAQSFVSGRKISLTRSLALSAET